MKTIKNFLELVTHLEANKSRQDLIYRGQANADWKLLPKSGRPEYFNKYSRSFSEKSVFESWVRYAKFYIGKEPNNLWDWMAIAQHYGLATRLLDWSKNPLVAAYFACCDNKESDGALYSYKVMNGNNPDVEDPFEFAGFSIFFPSGMAARIINQRGLLTVSGQPNIPLEDQLDDGIQKLVINREAKEDIIASLEYYNINKLSLYQDLNSLSDYLNEYVVRLDSKRGGTTNLELTLKVEEQ